MVLVKLDYSYIQQSYNCLSKIAGAPGIIWATSILLAITTIALGWQVLLLTKRSPIKIINQ